MHFFNELSDILQDRRMFIAPAGFFGPRGPKTRGGTLGLPA